MTTSDFYDHLSDFYHLLFPEGFDVSIQRHAEILNSVIRKTWGKGPVSIIDASCGIGTQTIGLTQLGYRVSASDLSSGAINRAKREAESRNLSIPLYISNMRNLTEVHSKPADIVISIDSAIQHLLSDEAILCAFQQFYALSKSGGGCIISARDYENENIENGTIRPYGIKEIDGAKFLILQVWECRANIYGLSMYIIKDLGRENCTASVFRTQYYPISISHLMELLEKAGFVDVQRIDNIFFQPIIIGSKV